MTTATAPTRQATYHGQPHNDDELTKAQRRIAELERALAQTGAALAERERERDEAITQLAYVAKVHRIGNEKLSAGQRLTLLALHHELERKAHRATPDGWTPVHLPNIAGACGQSAQSVSPHLTHLATCKGIERKTVTVTNANGTRRNQVYVRPLPALYEPDELRPPAPRQHGGKPTCRTCGTETMKLVRRIYQCTKCGLRHVEHIGQPTACQVDSRLEDTPADEVETPTGNEVDMSPITKKRGAIVTASQVDSRLLAWLAEVAGDGVKHIEMQPKGNAKYLWRDGAVTEQLVAAHLAGNVTVGATLRRADGKTLATCFDVDTEARADTLAAAAVKLTVAGAYVTYSESPAKNEDGTRRGARLDIYYAEPVDAANARATALRHAPELADIVEYWPNNATGNGQATRLPFARYRRGDVDAWCDVAFMDGERLTGVDAAQRVYSDERTPAAWVTETAAPETPAASAAHAVQPSARSLVIQSEPLPPNAPRRRPAALTDAKWLAKHGEKAATLWFAVTVAEAAAWFNARHNVADMLEVNAHGYGLATWRGERTASVKLTESNGFIDYGASATVKAGDALELWCLVHNMSRAVVLASVARTMQDEARRELEAAGHTGAGLPAWVHDITTPAGWQHYDRLRDEPRRLTTKPQRFAGQNRARQAHNSRETTQ